jgi:hypothetical protein
MGGFRVQGSGVGENEAEMGFQAAGAAINGGWNVCCGECSKFYHFVCDIHEMLPAQSLLKVQHHSALDDVFQARRPFIHYGVVHQR